MDHAHNLAKLLAELEAAHQRIQALEHPQGEAAAGVQAGSVSERLAQVLELLPMGIAVLDENRKIVFQNSALLEILDMNLDGLQTGAYKHRTYLAADGSPMAPKDFASVQAERSGKAVYNVETGVVKEDGQIIWTSVSAAPLDFPDWKTVVVTVDITERKRLEISLRESEQRYTLLFQKSTIPAILLKLPEVTIADVNEAAEALTGFTRPEMLGQTAAALGIISQEQRSEAVRQFEHMGALAENERQIFNKAGEAHIVVSRTNPVELGGQRYAITTLEDVTEQKKSREELALAYNVLAEAQKIAHLGSFEYVAATQTTVWSEEEYRIYGLDPNEPSPEYTVMLQKCVHPDDAALLHETFTKAMQSACVYEFEHRVVRPDGSVRWVYDRAHPYLNQQGEIIRYIGVTLDITERKQTEQYLIHKEEVLRQRTEELEQLLDFLPDAVWIAEDPECKVIHGNRFANTLLGITKADNISQSADAPAIVLRQFSQGRELTPDELPMQVAARTGQPQTDFELRIEHPSKPPRTLLGGAVPLFDAHGNPRGAVASFHDITERKDIEDELRRSNAELEQFAYVASHDLQEPLRAMAGMVQLLQQRYRGRLDERADEYINLAVEASIRMQNLINDLLALSRVDRRGKPLEAVPMQTSVETALKNLSLAVQESHAQVTWDELPTVRADGGQLIQLFQNLIGNAIKFRGESEPRIHIWATQLGEAWQVSVRDQGIGIEPQYFERIFQVFQRLHTRAAYPGTGIGLALCKKIVERHGGVIWVESTPGAGATFHFTIPLRRKSDALNPGL